MDNPIKFFNRFPHIFIVSCDNPETENGPVYIELTAHYQSNYERRQSTQYQFIASTNRLATTDSQASSKGGASQIGPASQVENTSDFHLDPQDRICIVKLLSDKPRVHVNWLYKQLTSYRGNACTLRSLQEMIEFIYDSTDFDMHEDGYVRLLDITPRNSDPVSTKTVLSKNTALTSKTQSSTLYQPSVGEILNVVGRPTIGSQRKRIATSNLRKASSVESLRTFAKRDSTRNSALNPFKYMVVFL